LKDVHRSKISAPLSEMGQYENPPFWGLYQLQPAADMRPRKLTAGKPTRDIRPDAFSDRRQAQPEDSAAPPAGRDVRRIRDLAMPVAPKDEAPARHETRCCRGLQSTDARSM
jgi:hypothetical protein